MYKFVIWFLIYRQAYAIEPRIEWVRDWPGQVVLCVSQAYWTKEVHEAIRTGPGGLKEYWDNLNKQLNDIVVLVRGKLPKQTRTTLGALVVLDVHARDVVLDMANKGRLGSGNGGGSNGRGVMEGRNHPGGLGGIGCTRQRCGARHGKKGRLGDEGGGGVVLGEEPPWGPWWYWTYTLEMCC